MLILGLNTCDNGYISISLSNKDNIISTINKHTKKTEQTVNLIYELFENLSINPYDLSGIGLITGPGGYTGIRAGISVAKTISQLIDIPIIGFSKSEALIKSYSNDSEKYICPLVDVKRDEVYTCISDKSLNYVLKPSVMTLENISKTLKESNQNIIVLASEIPEFDKSYDIKKENILFDYQFSIDSPEICKLTYNQILKGVNTKYNDIFPIYAREAI